MSVATVPILPVNAAPAPQTANKMESNKQSNNGKKGSFSDKLETAIAKDATVEPEQEQDTKKIPTNLLINSMPINLLLNGSSSATSLLPIDAAGGKADVSVDSIAVGGDAVMDAVLPFNNISPVLDAALPRNAVNPNTVVSAENVLTEQTSVVAAMTESQTAAVLSQTSTNINAEQAGQPAAKQTSDFSELVSQILDQKLDETQSNLSKTAVLNQKNVVSSDIPIPVLTEVATRQQAQTAKTISAANSDTIQTNSEAESNGLFAEKQVSKPEANWQQGSTGKGADDALSDHSQTLDQTKLALDAKVTVVENAAPHSFAQGLNAMLQTAGANNAGGIGETAAQQGSVADTHQIAEQIIAQTKVIVKPQNTEMVIKLKPEHLGELTLKVAVENGVVSASFHSNNPEVRNVIEASLPQLKQELANTGLKVDNVSVYAGLSQFLPNHDQERNSRQQFVKLTNKRSADDFVEAIDGELADAKVLETGSDSGVDYRI